MKQKPKTKSSTSHYEPLIIEEWALSLLKANKNRTIISAEPIARIDVEDAGCEICCDPGTHEEHTEQGNLPTTDMYQSSVCNRTYHRSCRKQLQYYKEEDRSNIDAQSDWSCPACHDLSLDEKEARSHASQHESLKVTWSPTWDPKELLHSWASFRQIIQIHEAKQIAPPWMKDLTTEKRQGFCTSINHSKWKSTQGKQIRSKACFDMQPTNPHVDITPTGHYGVWIRTVDLVRLKDNIAQKRSPMINATHKASFPKLYEARAACIYKPDGKCIGMMTPEHFHL
jgi:hypothetical protein